MATRTTKKTKAAKRTPSRASESKVTIDRGERNERSSSSNNFLDKIQTDLEKNQSYLNLVLGALIVIVLGVLVFNYFNKPSTETGDLGPSQQVTDEQGDVKKEALPGSYKVKEGDTLFLIAQKYYDNGDKYTEIMTANNLNSDSIEVGQSLMIPKLSDASPDAMAQASSSPEASASPEASSSPAEQAMMDASPSPMADQTMSDAGKGGAINQTIWGETITGNEYTVQPGDWLSKISGRAYNGDIMQYEKIAKANNITNPNSIEVGTVLRIPRD